MPIEVTSVLEKIEAANIEDQTEWKKLGMGYNEQIINNQAWEKFRVLIEEQYLEKDVRYKYISRTRHG